jgi:hypothetical protein
VLGLLVTDVHEVLRADRDGSGPCQHKVHTLAGLIQPALQADGQVRLPACVTPMLVLRAADPLNNGSTDQ